MKQQKEDEARKQSFENEEITKINSNDLQKSLSFHFPSKDISKQQCLGYPGKLNTILSMHLLFLVIRYCHGTTMQ